MNKVRKIRKLLIRVCSDRRHCALAFSILSLGIAIMIAATSPAFSQSSKPDDNNSIFHQYGVAIVGVFGAMGIGVVWGLWNDGVKYKTLQQIETVLTPMKESLNHVDNTLNKINESLLKLTSDQALLKQQLDTDKQLNDLRFNSIENEMAQIRAKLDNR